MSKVITSPVKKWAGTVTIADPLTIPQAEQIENALGIDEAQEEGKRVWLTVNDKKMLPAIFACVEAWNLQGLEGVTIDTFPASPRSTSHKLIDWLFREILHVYFGEAEVPNE